MDFSACLDALFEHARLCGSVSEKPNGNECEKTLGTSQADTNPAIALAGSDIARKFAEQAANLLPQEEFTQLLKFLEPPKAVFDGVLQQLQSKVTAALEEFYFNEIVISGHDREGLGRPCGPQDADLSMVLHLETKDLDFGNFFDLNNATIGLLHDKGLRSEFAFGFDWHWWGETKEQWLDRRHCPFGKWNNSFEISTMTSPGGY